MGFLSDINASVRRALEREPLDARLLEARADERGEPRDLHSALSRDGISIIAEVKRSSPSVGSIAETDPGIRAVAYEEAGAQAMSVLTEGVYFGGSLADLDAAAAATTRVPILRKDFLLEPVQLAEARAHGADAVLLITASLSDRELNAMLREADARSLGVLLETHSASDLERALATDCPLIGVNARDLETLEVDLGRAMSLVGRIPSDRLSVLESGISDASQVAAARDAGAAAVLVGEALMRASDPAAKIRELRGDRP